jgi:hypothetical protein
LDTAKDHIGLAMITTAEDLGLIKTATILVERTSGETTISLVHKGPYIISSSAESTVAAEIGYRAEMKRKVFVTILPCLAER